MTATIDRYKKGLLEEREVVLKELQSVGRINPDNINDWEAVAGEMNNDPAEEEERATEITDFEERSAIEFELETRLNALTNALKRIENGTYGICSVCKKPIETERLEANYSAETCKAHMT